MSLTEPVRRRLSWGILAAAAGASILFIGLQGRGETLRGDEWSYAARLADQSLVHAILHAAPGKYLVAGPLVVYKILYGTVGIGSYLPYRLLGLALLILASALLFELARRRIGYMAALPLAILPLFLGAGAEVVGDPLRMPSQFAICAGLGALLALEARGRRRDALACVLLVVAVTSHPVGLAFLAAGAVRVLLRSRESRWRSAWIFAVPLAVYLIWYIALREPATASTGPSIGDVADFAVRSFVAFCAAATGLFRPPWASGGDFINPISVVVAVAFAVVLLVALRRAREVPASLWAALAALLVLMVAPAFAPGPVRDPTAPRYLYPGVIVLLLAGAELARGVRLRGEVAVAAVTAGAMVFAVSMFSNVRTLNQRLSFYASSSTLLKAELTGLNVVRTNPGFRSATLRLPSPPGEIGPGVANTIAATDRFGDPAFTLGELAAKPSRVRSYADLTVGSLLRVGLVAVDARPSSGPRPLLTRSLGGTSAEQGPCVELRPGPGGEPAQPQPVAPSPPTAASEPPPPLAELTLRAPASSIEGQSLDEVGLRIGQFTDPPVVSLDTRQLQKPVAVVGTPPGPSDLQWRLIVYASRPVRVCGAAPAAQG
jgi:hypothetical protein